MFQMDYTDAEVLLQNSEFTWFWNKTKEDVVSLFWKPANHIVSCKGLVKKDVT